jgi:hypothetical protein
LVHLADATCQAISLEIELACPGVLDSLVDDQGRMAIVASLMAENAVNLVAVPDDAMGARRPRDQARHELLRHECQHLG